MKVAGFVIAEGVCVCGHLKSRHRKLDGLCKGCVDEKEMYGRRRQPVCASFWQREESIEEVKN